MSGPIQLQLHDTLSRAVRPLAAGDGRRFRIYCCGPTVYGPAHIGNFRTFVLNDVLRRVAEVAGLEPRFVRNITDIDDKTIAEARGRGGSLADLASVTAHWTRVFHEDGAALHLMPPDVEPKATEHVAEQIALVQALLDKGLAYATADGSVYYRVSAFPGYGKLSGFSPEELRTQEQNSAGRANQADEYDRGSVADFALWKGWKPEDGEIAWDAPWGRGRPGWHLECSAMSRKHLGHDFDLHTGGVDLCFPHHENEIAQSEGAFGGTYCRHWWHATHLIVDGKKMSKSLGNFHTVRDLVAAGHHPAAIRYVLLSAHYRQQLNFTLKGVDDALSALLKLRRLVQQVLAAVPHAEIAALPEPLRLREGVALWDAVSAGGGQPIDGGVEGRRRALWAAVPGSGLFGRALEALADDLNTPAALGELFKVVHLVGGGAGQVLADQLRIESLVGMHRLFYALGLDAFFRSDAKPLEREAVAEEAPAEARELAEARWQAKQARDWAKADALRQQVAALGWVIKDRKDGYDLAKG